VRKKNGGGLKKILSDRRKKIAIAKTIRTDVREVRRGSRSEGRRGICLWRLGKGEGLLSGRSKSCQGEGGAKPTDSLSLGGGSKGKAVPLACETRENCLEIRGSTKRAAPTKVILTRGSERGGGV